MILVTGGAGYVGAGLVEALVRGGHQVRVLDWFLFEEHPFSAEIDPVVDKRKGDIRDEAAVLAALEGVQAVIHLAAVSNDPSADLAPELTWQTNYEGTLLLLRLARQRGVQRFINASSASVYGIQDLQRVTEECPPAPITCYAQTKAKAEEHVLAANSSEFTTVSLRPATLVGYSMRLRLDIVANIFAYQAFTSGRITVLGGEQRRPLLSVEDMIRTYQLMLTADAGVIGGKTYNVSAENHSVAQIARMVAEVFGGQVEIETKPSNDNRSYSLYAGKVREELGWEPQVPIRESIASLIDAFKQGLIPDPHARKYRNIQLMLDRQVATSGIR